MAQFVDFSAVQHLNAEEQGKLQSSLNIIDPVKRWQFISKEVLTPNHPFELHKQLHEINYQGADVAPLWAPTEEQANSTNIKQVMNELSFDNYQDFYNFSIRNPEAFWDHAINKVGIVFHQRYSNVFEYHSDAKLGVKNYLPNARLNIIESCFNKRPPSDIAIYFACEEDPTVKHVTFAQLGALSNRVANTLLKPVSEGGLGLNFGDAVGICMPMSVEAVAAYMGIIKAGLSVVSIADSFSAPEINMRMKLAKAKAIFTQDVVYRKDKYLELFTRVLKSNFEAKVVIIPGHGNEIHSSVQMLMRENIDYNWYSLLWRSSDHFDAVDCPADHTCNILFSSGTTGEPKAIPWSHATPIKCAIDGFFHQDIQVGEVVAWPTNLGWMMGPWLLFQFINGASLSLFGGVTSTNTFCRFVEETRVSMLGVVPSLIKSWFLNNTTVGCDWTCVKNFSSSGEASDATTMLWLSSRAGYRPIIEYCGGTEVAGSYLSSTMVQPNVASMFSTPVLGSNFVILDHDGKETLQGELALIPPALGLSVKLLNRDHYECYFSEMPAGPNGEILRRHGDEVQAVPWKNDHDPHTIPQKFYRALGRCDDTMNLGGIKVSSVEIERVCNEAERVAETAAIGVSPPKGGPSQLIVFVVLKDHPDVHPDTHIVGKGENMESLAKELKSRMQGSIKANLNPLFHVGDVVIVEKLPRTASNKIMRRILRDDYVTKSGTCVDHQTIF